VIFYAWWYAVPFVSFAALQGIDHAVRNAYESTAGAIVMFSAFALCLTAAAIAFVRWRRSDRRLQQSECVELALERCVEERTRALRQEIEDRRRAEQLNRGQKRVLELLANPGDLTTNDILQSLADVVASRSQGWECSIYLVERRGRILTQTAASSVNERVRGYLRGVGKDFPDTPECQAGLSGKTQVVAHLSQLDMPWGRLLLDSGIFSIWSIPFSSTNSGRLRGVLTVYSRSRRGPTALELEMAESAARLAGLVVEHRSIREELLRTAYQDAVTELPNRNAGVRAVEEAIRTAKADGSTFALFWIDISRFKRINDHYGSSIADAMLRTVANRLKHHPLVTGTVARMNVDEFMVLVPGTAEILDPFEIARRLRSAIAQPFHAGRTRIDPTAAIGASVYPSDGTNSQSLIRDAEFAMYRAKTSSEGFCIFSPAMNDEAIESLAIEEALSAAIEENQLRLVYQPIYTATGELVSFEALLRFQHPELGNIPPSRFIPIAEETRHIVAIGNWVMRQACSQLRTWLDAGLPGVRMSINVSALQFAHDDFSDNVASILESYGIDPHLLTIELTESVVLEDFTAVLRQMNLLRQCGIHIAMDDFGTGYSSLSYLHRIPVDVLKIDRSFIEKLAEADGTRPIVEAVLSLAQRLGLTVVAEGVETAEQHEILKNAGCHEYQGFLFARPMPSADAEKCLAASRTVRFANPLQQGDFGEAAIA